MWPEGSAATAARLRESQRGERKNDPCHRRLRECRHNAWEDRRHRTDPCERPDIFAVARSRLNRDLEPTEDQDGRNHSPSRSRAHARSFILLLRFRSQLLDSSPFAGEVSDRRNDTVADRTAFAMFVDLEQLRRECDTTRV